MGDQGVGRTAFKRIEKFNDDRTEQVWELFREEFSRAAVAEDGETSWRVAAAISGHARLRCDRTRNQQRGDRYSIGRASGTYDGA